MDGAPKKGNLRDRHSPPSFSAYFRFDNWLRTFKNTRLRDAGIIPELYTSSNARKTIYTSYVGRALKNEVCCLIVSLALPHHLPVSRSSPSFACLSLALPHHLPDSRSSPSLACLSLALRHHPLACPSLFSITRLTLALPHQSPA